MSNNDTINHASIVSNRATPDGATQPIYPDCCVETLLFGMRDNDHEFSVGLSTLLQCLQYAEREGEVPGLPDDWWTLLYNRYRCLNVLDPPGTASSDALAD